LMVAEDTSDANVIAGTCRASRPCQWQCPTGWSTESTTGGRRSSTNRYAGSWWRSATWYIDAKSRLVRRNGLTDWA